MKMHSAIYSIFSGTSDELVHGEFIKFSKGLFKDRYRIAAKRQKDAWTIKTTAEFANFFVRHGLERTKEALHVTGAIITTMDLRKETQLSLAHFKQFQGIKQHIVDTEISPAKILALMDKYPRAFFALSFKLQGYELKIKAKAPKSGKPATKGNKDEETKPDFCSLKTTYPEIISDLFFDVPSFQEISINHTVEVSSITLPKGVSDPVQIREKSMRDGVMHRILVVDGKESKTQKSFRI